MKMTVGRLKQLSADERARMLFEARELYLMDEAVRRDTAVAEGKAEAKAETKLEMAKRMLLKGFAIETISEVSDMSVDEIMALIRPRPVRRGGW
jgi:predicted transposase/invertase (TIGR01784 family)